MTDILIGWKEIAKHLKVTDNTARRYMKQKNLPVRYNPAGHPVIKKAIADEWLAKTEQKGE